MKISKNIFFFITLLLAFLLLTSFDSSNPDDENSFDYTLEEMQKEIADNGYSFVVGDTGLSDYTISDLCGFIPPSDEVFMSEIENPEPVLKAIPASFSWQTQGMVTSVKSQGNCGACWAFASIALLESAVKIHDGIDDNLSEQWLVSCTNAGSCDGADTHAFAYMGNGTAKESCFPYQAANVACKSGCRLYYPLWGYGNLSNYVSNLKNAIYTYGPIFTSVYVDEYFKNYAGGVYDRNSYGYNNHAVVLVGWDDSRGAWHMKNSWCSNWGESGYMWIKYGVQGIGRYSGYCDYKGQVTPVPTPVPTPEQTRIPTPTPGNGDVLTGQYYNNSEFKSLVLTRVDQTIDFNWGEGSPDSSIDSETYSIRWTGEVEPHFSENYTFYTNTDDGVRLRVNNQLIIDNWVDQAATEVSGTINLNAGTQYDIEMEYYENSGDAVAQLSWSSLNHPKEIIPRSQLFSGGIHGTLGDVNSDGTVNIVDALLIAQYYVGLNPANFNPDFADTNCDGSVNIVDALVIAQYYVGIITQFC